MESDPLVLRIRLEDRRFCDCSRGSDGKGDACSLFRLRLSVHTAHFPHRFVRPLLRPVGTAVAGTVWEDIVSFHVPYAPLPAGRFDVLGGALKYSDDGA